MASVTNIVIILEMTFFLSNYDGDATAEGALRVMLSAVAALTT